MKASKLVDRLFDFVSPERKIPGLELQLLWKERERKEVVSASRVLFALFFIFYLLHIFFIDLPLKKEKIEVWIIYRLSVSVLSLLSLLLMYWPKFLKSGLFRAPLYVVSCFSVLMQAESMLWRQEVPYGYSIVLASLCTLALRKGLFQSLIFALFLFSLSLRGWSSRPQELPYILSAAMVSVIVVCVLRANVSKDVFLFLQVHREFETQRRLFAAERALGLVTIQVAHDIRSPLIALNTLANDMTDLPEDKRLVLRSAVTRIRDIANDLMNRRQGSPERETEEDVNQPTPQLISNLVDGLLSEKRLQYRSRFDLEIKLESGGEIYGASASVQPGEFRRVLSNLIDNAVEAISDPGRVLVSIESSSTEVKVRIRDSGKGIPPEILPRLMTRGETHGKSQGSGLGLYHAKTTLERWGGRVEIASQTGSGTVVTLTLPRTSPPQWFLAELDLSKGAVLVILDDDAAVHQLWRARFERLPLHECEVKVVHFYSPDSFIQWFNSGSRSEASHLYLLDQEFLGSQETGLALVKRFSLERQSVLVTSRFDDPEIQAAVVSLGVRLIPKAMAVNVPVRLPDRLDDRGVSGASTLMECALIASDPLLHLTWKTAAEERGRRLHSFFSADYFYSVASRFETSLPVYVDSDSSILLKLKELGFQRVSVIEKDARKHPF